MGIIGGIFHITNRPGERLYRALKLGSLEGVLASAGRCTICFFRCFRNNVVRFSDYTNRAFSPTRYQWDSGYFKTEINRRVQAAIDDGATKSEAYVSIPEKLAFYDYVGIVQLKGDYQSWSSC